MKINKTKIDDNNIQLLRELKRRLDQNEHTNYENYLSLLDTYKIPRHAAFNTAKVVFGIDNVHFKTFKTEFLTLDAYFMLLEHEELQQARIDSKEARVEARGSMRMAVFAVVISSALALTQILIAIFSPGH